MEGNGEEELQGNSGGKELQGKKTMEGRSFRGIKQWRRGGASGE